MKRIGRILFSIFVSCLLVLSESFVDDEHTIDNIQFFEELEFMDPIVVPEPEDGTPWWYTPSRKAHMFKHRYQPAIRQLHQSHNEKQVETKQGEDMRLPGDIIPINYNVRMFPFVELIESGNYTTDGYVEILVQCLKATSNISINSAELYIEKETISACFSRICCKILYWLN